MAGFAFAGAPRPAAAEAWRMKPLPAAGRVLAAALPPERPKGGALAVVIEGDGRAFDSRGRPTADPTPRRPLGLALAKAWPGGGAAWLGRLCQYVKAQDPRCEEADWTGGRFSDEAVAAADAALDALKAESGAERLVLAGWSGGGAMAVLVAARRHDVDAVVTLAAPLDLAAWTRWHGAVPLAGSLDPARLGELAVPQVHLFGRFDTVTPPATATTAAARLAGARGVVRLLPERHDCCWERRLALVAALLNDGFASRPERGDDRRGP